MRGRATAARLRPAVVLVAWVAAACASETTAPLDGPLSGSWGGPQASLVADDQGARVELACAEGRIEGPVILEAGRFAEIGPWQPGPVPVSDPRFAHFSGFLAGSRIELTIVVAPNGPTHGPFELERGRAPTFLRC